MTTQNQVTNSAIEAIRRIIHEGQREMLTGKRVGSQIVMAGAPTGKTWVRSNDASREATAVYGVITMPNVSVVVGPDLHGHDRILYVPESSNVPTFGDKVALLSMPPVQGDLVGLDVTGRNFRPGRVRPYADSGSMLVYVEPFAHHEGYYAGGTIDLTGDIPATAGTCAWVAVALDPATGTLYSYAGSDNYDAPTNLDEADAHAISIPTGYMPLAAAVLEEGMTEITSATRIIDLRPHFYMRGGLIRALDDLANVNTTGKADGDALVWDAGASEWIPGAGGGSIDVGDGTTTVSPATKLLFDATKFDVIDNGGGQAEVTLLAAGGQPSQKTTATLYVEEVIADVELSSAGTFDVSNIPSDYDDLRIVLVTRAAAATTGVNNLWTFNGDTNNANYQVQIAAINNVLAAVVNGASRRWSVTVADTGTANFWTEIHTHIPLYASTTRFKALHMDGADPRGAPNDQWRLAYTGIWKSTAAINRIQIAADNANPNFKAGSRLRILGIKQQQVVTDVIGGGLDTSTANVSNPPTDAELDSALGTPAAVGAGYQCLLDDGGADTNVYLVVSNGTSWWTTALTKAT